MSITLHPDQQEALDAVLAAYHTQPVGGKALVIAPTGWGKTIFFSTLARELGRKGNILIIAHRDELLNQAIEKLQSIDPTAIVGKVGGNSHEYGAPITVAGIDTISKDRHLKNLHKFGYTLIIVDECFPAGTLIDGKPIEQIKAGDIVTAFNEHTGAFAPKKVMRIFRRPAGLHLVKITSGQHAVVCTPNHPFYTTSGWKTAQELTREDHIIHVGNHSAMQHLPAAIPTYNQMATALFQQRQKSLLFRHLQERLYGTDIISNDVTHQQEIRFSQDESQQSYEERRESPQNESNLANHGAQTSLARGQWQGSQPTTKDTCKEAQLAYGVCSHNHTATENKSTDAQSLQNRYCQSRSKNCYRDRWDVSRNTATESPGLQEGTSAQWVRVDNIEIYEPGSDGTFGGLCPDGYVYNFEVEDFHTYTANGFVVHNCHHAPAPKYQRVLQALPQAFRVGVTATAERLDGKSLEPIFGKPLFKMSIVDAIAKSRLSNIRAIAIRTETNLDDIRSTRNADGEIDFNQRELEEAIDNEARNQRVVEGYLEHAAGRRAIAFCVSINHAQRLAQAFEEFGIPAGTVDGETPLTERKKLYQQLRSGEIKVLTNVLVLTEGFDLPQVDCILMARPTQSQSLYIQCVGRGARLSPLKKDCLVLDLTDNSQRLRLAPQNLKRAIGLDLRDNELILDAVERLEDEEAEKEAREKRALIRKLNERREKDVEVRLFGLPEWQERENGLYVMEVGPARHRLALVPLSSNSWSQLYDVCARLAPDYTGQRWLKAQPLDTALQYAEKRARQLLEDPDSKKILDKNASWRNYPVDPESKQAKMLRWYRIPITPGMTKGEASDLIDGHKAKIEKRKADKAARDAEKQLQAQLQEETEMWA